MNRPKINITIPTYNRAYCLPKAIKAALNQSYDHITVTVVDDASTDNTAEVIKPFLSEPNFCYIQLGKNVGTAQAKNVSMLYSDYDAITFHDSDDIPDENKVLLQCRALCVQGHIAAPILNWGALGHTPGSELEIDVVVGAHKMIKLDGSVHYINKRISLVDDFFPTLQFPSKTEGDWILINSGLFRKRVFESLGGYMDSVEEDRELRNRTIGCGHLYYYLEEPLLTKIEMGVSLTVSNDTGYYTDRRRKDREDVWDRLRLIRRSENIDTLRSQLRTEVDLSALEIRSISRPELLHLNTNIPHTPGSADVFKKATMQYA